MQPLVSVVCLVYNHASYLRKTLDGFMEQQTTFPFEIVIHDDASTDGSRAIIEEYAQRYPDVFVPILQTENQYSKKVKISKTFIYPKCRGEYIAFCEGDDYWSDPHKLQMQVDFLAQNPQCSMCVHDTMRIDPDGESLNIRINGCTAERDYSADDVIAADGGGLFHFSSVLARRNVALERPAAFDIPGIGDYPLAIYGSTCGNVHYLGKVMSCYRTDAQNSWSDRMERDRETFLQHCEVVVSSLRRIDHITEGRFHRAFCRPIGRRLLLLYRMKYGLHRLLLYPKDLFCVLYILPEKILVKLRRGK